MAITPAVFDSQIEECIPQVGGVGSLCGGWVFGWFHVRHMIDEGVNHNYISCPHATTTTTTMAQHNRSPRCWRAPRWTGPRRPCGGTAGSSSRCWRSAPPTSTWASKSTGSYARRLVTWRCPPAGASRRLRGCVASRGGGRGDGVIGGAFCYVMWYGGWVGWWIHQ